MAKKYSPVNTQMKLLLHDDEFWSLIEKCKKRFSEERGLEENIQYSRYLVTQYLDFRKLPFTWLEPIIGYIRTDQFYEPLNNNISIKIGDVDLVKSKNNKDFIYNPKNFNFTELGDTNIEKGISITIKSKISIGKIIKFIEENAELIKEWQNKLQLPDYKDSRLQKITEAIQIVDLKDNKKMSFTEISDYLSKNTMDLELSDYYSDVLNIKNIYYNYRNKITKLSSK